MNITSINASSSLVIIITCHHHHCHHHHLSSSSLVIIITCHHHHCHHHHCHHHVRLFDKLTKRNLNIKSNNSWRRLIINRESKWSKGRYTLPVALHDNAFSNRARKHGPCSDACPDYPCWCLKWQPCSRLTFLTPVNAGACPHYPWTEHGCHFRHPSSRPVNMGVILDTRLHGPWTWVVCTGLSKQDRGDVQFFWPSSNKESRSNQAEIFTRILAVAKRPCDCCVGQCWPNITRGLYFADIIGLSSTTVT